MKQKNNFQIQENFNEDLKILQFLKKYVMTIILDII